MGWILGLAVNARADSGSLPAGLEAGVLFGEPTGLTGKIRESLAARTAWDFGLAYSFSHFVRVYGDHLWDFPEALASRPEAFLKQVQPYVGVGGALVFKGAEGVAVAVRIPLGLEWLSSETPISFFLEAVPGVGILPSTFSYADGGLGVRYRF